jgi:hypothetical protein
VANQGAEMRRIIRQNGGTTFKVSMFIDRCDISMMSEAIARTDSPTTTVRMTNTRHSRIGKQLFIGFHFAEGARLIYCPSRMIW